MAHVVLPDADDTPAVPSQPPRNFPIARLIDGDLVYPECAIRTRHRSAHRMPVPEIGVNKHGDFLPPKNNIRRSVNVHAVAGKVDASSLQFGHQQTLRLRVLGADVLHVPSALFRGEVVHGTLYRMWRGCRSLQSLTHKSFDPMQIAGDVRMFARGSGFGLRSIPIALRRKANPRTQSPSAEWQALSS